ncbi:MAG: hypothetical protein ACI8XC_000581 [Gammaproteobacteria bacterium]|jgi:hypothetical protein
MIKFLLWRLMFEYFNCIRILGPGRKQVFYFAFGANLSDAIMRERQIKPARARPFVLRDFGLRFDHPAAWKNGAYASAEPSPSECAYGYLYSMCERDARRMDFYEGVPILKRYRRREVIQDGQAIFFYQTNRSTPNLSPTTEYLGFIVDGLATHPEVPNIYFNELAATQTQEPGEFVANYLRNLPDNPQGLFEKITVAYEKLTVKLFLKVIYRYSPTAWMIRAWR